MTTSRLAPRLLLLASALTGVVIGIGAYTFVYARGSSYLTDNAEACANCHIMGDHYRAWTRGSHRSVATCNDCHTPSGFVPKYVMKLTNGFWHTVAFTTGRFPDPLQITARNHAAVEVSCRRCHADLIAALVPAHPSTGRGGPACTRCHQDVGHIE